MDNITFGNLTPTLDYAEFGQAVSDYMTLKGQLREAEASARALKGRVEALQGRILGAFPDSAVAVCGNWTLMRTAKKGVEATLTTNGGEKIPFSEVEEIFLKAGGRVRGSDVVTLYGGRSGSVSLEVR